jgi:anti-anti-sigma factor
VTSYNLEQRPSVQPGLVLIEVSGELDLTNAAEVEQRLEGFVGAGNGAGLVLDLNRLVFIDSAALHVLFRTARRLGKARFGVVLQPTAAVASTVSIVGLAEVAHVAPSTEELLPLLHA